MTNQQASPGERVAVGYFLHAGNDDYCEKCVSSEVECLGARIDAAIREAVEEDCRAVCILCARRVPFVKSKLGYFLHADPTGWEQCRAAPIRRLRAALEAKSEGSAT